MHLYGYLCIYVIIVYSFIVNIKKLDHESNIQMAHFLFESKGANMQKASVARLKGVLLIYFSHHQGSNNA
jgi:hypothetical protein